MFIGVGGELALFLFVRGITFFVYSRLNCIKSHGIFVSDYRQLDHINSYRIRFNHGKLHKIHFSFIKKPYAVSLFRRFPNNIVDSFIPHKLSPKNEGIPLNDDDVWNMTVHTSQNATMGIDWVKTIELLQSSTNSTVSPLTIAYNSALSAAEKNSNIGLSIEIIKDMKNQTSKVIDAVSYKILISTCVKCDCVDEAIEFYNEMVTSGFPPDHGIIRNMLWLLSKHKFGGVSINMLDKLKSLSNVCKNEDFVTQVDYMYAIESCIRTQMFKEAMELYNEMKTLKTYNLTEEILNSLLFMCHITSEFNLTMELYSSVLKSKAFDLTLTHYKLIISILLSCQKFDLIDSVSLGILEDKKSLDYTISQLIMQSYVASGNYNDAFKLLGIMSNNNLLMNRVEPFVMCIKSCELCGEWKLAMKILRMCQQNMHVEDIELYNSVLSVLAKSEEWDNMITLYNELRKGNYEDVNPENSSPKSNGNTIAYMLMAYYHVNDMENVSKLLNLPVVDTPLLMKLRNTINIQQ